MNFYAFLDPPRSRIERPWTSTRDVVFLDYDGVLHRGDTYRTRSGIVSSASHIRLFEFADVLNELLVPYPGVELVLSTNWVKTLSFNEARDAMPLEALRRRVRGATYHTHFHDAHKWNGVPRGAQILRYVERHRLVRWLALDDRSDGFGVYGGHLVLCDLDRGLGDIAVQAQLAVALEMQFGAREG